VFVVKSKTSPSLVVYQFEQMLGRRRFEKLYPGAAALRV
jgi:hypothetical protein